jgi:hypothetical protein
LAELVGNTFDGGKPARLTRVFLIGLFCSLLGGCFFIETDYAIFTKSINIGETGAIACVYSSDREEGFAEVEWFARWGLARSEKEILVAAERESEKHRFVGFFKRINSETNDYSILWLGGDRSQRAFDGMFQSIKKSIIIAQLTEKIGLPVWRYAVFELGENDEVKWLGIQDTVAMEVMGKAADVDMEAGSIESLTSLGSIRLIGEPNKIQKFIVESIPKGWEAEDYYCRLVRR